MNKSSFFNLLYNIYERLYMNIKDKLMSLYSTADRERAKALVAKIREQESIYSSMSDIELKTAFQAIRNEVNTEHKKVHMFALITIAIQRVLGLSPYDVQIQGGLILSDGKIAEMKTGEGKTLTSLYPIIYNACSGQVHAITVNEYLAERDEKYLAPVYAFFGLKSAFNKQQSSQYIKKNIYAENDIIYGIESTFVFDWLRDQMVMSINDKVIQKPFHFANIDEVDSVLIDNGRTPCIIGGEKDKDVVNIINVDKAVKQLKPTEDYIVDTQYRSVKLTDDGISKLEKLLNLENLYSQEHIYIMHLVQQALIANYVFKLDIDYAIKDFGNGMQLVIIDQGTGRIMADRRYNQGLHQALEAKHSDQVSIHSETVTIASITLQNFFRMYHKLAGMTGTGLEEADEFMEVYGLKVVPIDTNKPVIRVDHTPELYKTKTEKWGRVLELIKQYHEQDFPILIGTTSVHDSEVVSDILTREHIKHEVLNAKQDAKEAEIVAQAGKLGNITIATNMAGRGTDIVLEDKDHPLVVIQTEMNENGRIDRQLRGRSGRQGDKGITHTVISAEDSIFARSSLTDMLKRITTKDHVPTKMTLRVIKELQTELAGQASISRQNALKYDDIIREQRNKFYQSRDNVLRYNTVKELDECLAKLDIQINDDYLSDVERVTIRKQLLLSAMDFCWVQHLEKLESLKTGIAWRARSGNNPILVYQEEAQILYDNFLTEISLVIDKAVKGAK